ncbi:MAG: lysylphosphatidylglycerol synthase transmembrane domain-containing protein [Candidatus Rifleibacteriota bacterium]
MKKTLSTSTIIARIAVWLFLVSVAAITAIALFSDLHKVFDLLRTFELTMLPLIIAAVLFNYLLRFAKWCYFLRLIKVKVPFWQNLWVFFSAFTMVLSPGKIGELVKSFLLSKRFEIPVAKTAPVVMAERLTDLLGLMVLCSIGFTRFSFGGKTLAVVFGLLFFAVIALSSDKFWRAVEKFIAGFRRLEKLKRPVLMIKDSTNDLLGLKSLIIATSLSTLSWAGEGFALFLIFRSMNVDVPSLLLLAIFAHSFSSIVGALSFLPGGLLVTEGTMGMFFVYASIPDAQALSATFLIRAVTLWFAVIVGTLVFFIGRKPGDLEALQLVSAGKSEAKNE